MKKLTLTLTAIALSMGLSISSSCTASDEDKELYSLLVKTREKLYQQEKVIKEQAELIKRFDNYYHSTEILLDSVKIDPDTDLETDAGAQYLEDRYQLNQIFNKLESNPNHHH